MRGRALVALAGIAAVAAFAFVSHAVFSGGSNAGGIKTSKFATDPDSGGARALPGGEGPAGGWEAYLAAADAYPAKDITPAQVQKAEDTFAALSSKNDARWNPGIGNNWDQIAPQTNATEPGVLAFTGDTNTTASRTTALVVDPDCKAWDCRIWVGASGGGVWTTKDAHVGPPELGADQAEAARPELGRRPHARPGRQEARHALPRHGRGQPLRLRLRGGRRRLPDDGQGRALDQARRQVRRATRPMPA